MTNGRAPNRRRGLYFLSLAAVVTVTSAVTVPQIRTPILRFAGHALVLDEAIQTADAIVVVGGGDRSTLLDAADLVRAGVAPRVALLVDPTDSADRELERRGIVFENAAESAIQILRDLGIDKVEPLPKPAAGTGGIGRILPQWCDTQRYESVAIISPPDHTMRTRRVLDRAMKGHATKVRIRAARYSDFDPDRWWHSRDGTRTAVIELQKLLLDYLRYPF